MARGVVERILAMRVGLVVSSGAADMWSRLGGTAKPYELATLCRRELSGGERRGGLEADRVVSRLTGWEC